MSNQLVFRIPKTDDHSLDQVLLVDDDPINLQVLYKTLEDRGYKLLIARNGEDALDIARKTHLALVLLDIMMPGLDGFEVCRRLKSDPMTSHVAIIFLSALDATRDKVRGLDLGAVDYITKPFQAQEVIARVDTHLKIHHLEQRLQQRKRNIRISFQHRTLNRDMTNTKKKTEIRTQKKQRKCTRVNISQGLDKVVAQIR